MTRRPHSLFAVSLAALLAAACSSNDNPPATDGGNNDAGNNDAGPNDGGPSDAGTTDGGALVIAERVFSPSGRSYFVSILSSVPTGEIDRSKAHEFASADVEIYGGKIYIRDRTSSIVTRYNVGADLSLNQEAQVSFANDGFSGRVYNAYVNDHLAFALDGTNLKMRAWDPTSMTLTPASDIDVGYLAKGDLDISLGEPVRVGSRVVIPINYEDDNLNVAPGMNAALILDSNTAAAPPLLEGDQGVGGGYVVWGFDGNAYVGGTIGGDVKLFGGTADAGTVADGGTTPNSGILRINADAGTFDPSFKIDVNALTGSIGVWGIHLLDETHVLAQILDPAIDAGTIATPDDYYDSTSFYYVMIDTSTSAVTRQTAIPTGGIGNAQEHVIDGTLYVVVSNADGSGSDVYPVTAASGVGAKQFGIPAGDLWFARRLR